MIFLVADIYESTGEVLGEGSFGQVITHRNVNTGKEYAVKVWSDYLHFATMKFMFTCAHVQVLFLAASVCL